MSLWDPHSAHKLFLLPMGVSPVYPVALLYVIVPSCRHSTHRMIRTDTTERRPERRKQQMIRKRDEGVRGGRRPGGGVILSQNSTERRLSAPAPAPVPAVVPASTPLSVPTASALASAPTSDEPPRRHSTKQQQQQRHGSLAVQGSTSGDDRTKEGGAPDTPTNGTPADGGGGRAGGEGEETGDGTTRMRGGVPGTKARHAGYSEKALEERRARLLSQRSVVFSHEGSSINKKPRPCFPKQLHINQYGRSARRRKV